MSVAPEFPPVVSIPERARPGRRAQRALGVAGGAVAPRHLRLVGAEEAECLSGSLSGLAALDAGPAELPAGRLGAQALADSAARPVRLTRRGRLALSIGFAVLAAAFLAVAYWSAPAQSAMRAAVPGSATTVTVQAGDTLWSIAGRIAPTRDPRAVVDDLVSLNHLGGAALTPGQVLRIH